MMLRRGFVSCVVMLLLVPCVVLGQKPKAYVDPEKADRDFEFQGEYVGELTHMGNTFKVGMQVIAEGEGKFKMVSFIGGLPGDGWDGESREEVAATGVYNADTHSVEFKGDDRGVGEIAGGELIATDPDGNELGKFKKVTRKSKTLGEKAPEGAVVLFDGSGVEQWKNGQMTEDGLLKQGTTSKQSFGSHKIHIEFRLPYMPKARGQQRGNSGIYVQGRFEVQMLDSFGLAGKQNECGGLYSVADPDLNMCYPPLSWQTYDIEFTAAEFNDKNEVVKSARITVYHNGVKVHDDVELPNRATTAGPNKFGTSEGPIFLQNHGNEVRYRNIWVVETDK